MELGHNSSRTVENVRVTPLGYKYTHGGGGVSSQENFVFLGSSL